MAVIRFFQRFIPRRYWRTERLKQQVLATCNSTVLSGPFAGMKYLDESVGSEFVPKLLGTYERELHEIVERLISSRPTTLFNVGAAEGYYGIGFAFRLPHTRIVMWESTARGRELINELARKNGVPDAHVKVAGVCTPSGLRRELAAYREQSPLVVVDIEGGEGLLLDPEILPELETCTLLVEVHDFALEGVGDLLTDRFAQSHSIESIAAQDRSVADWPEVVTRLLRSNYRKTAVALMSEGRPKSMSWLYMRPKKARASA